MISDTIAGRNTAARQGGGFGATIHSIDVDGQRFNLQDGAPKLEILLQRAFLARLPAPSITRFATIEIKLRFQ
jgi:hypothetical protein